MYLSKLTQDRESWSNAWATKPVVKAAALRTFIVLFLVSAYLFLFRLGRGNEVIIQNELDHLLSSRDLWVEKAMNTVIDGEHDLGPVVELCRNTTWQEGITFNCPNLWGGVGNVRSKVLTCLRYAIQAGASSFIVPGVTLRSSKDISVLETGAYTDFGYMFDRSYFMNTVNASCPQMRLYWNIEDFTQNSWVKQSLALKANTLTGTAHRLQVAHPEDWRKNFDKWLLTKLEGVVPSNADPVIVDIDSPLLEWPLYYDGTSFSKAFGQMLRFNHEAREMGAIILYELAQVVKNWTTIDPRAGITKGAFYGAHLRTAKDAKDSGWLGYDFQSKMYVEDALKYNHSLIYVSSGSMADILVLKNSSWIEHRINVTSKDLLLQEEDLARLHAMSWDQQALVDYEVMLKTSNFGGIDASTFALNIAMRRHGVLNDAEREDKMGPVHLTNNPKYTISDDLSLIAKDPANGDLLYLGMFP